MLQRHHSLCITPLLFYIPKIKSQVRCLNEDVDGSVRSVFKPWNDRLNPSEITLKSDPDDCELLIHIPFDGMVKLRAICIIGGTNDSSPSKLRVFTNRDDLDFTAVENAAPVQEWDLNENFNGEIEYPTTVSKFNGVYSIDLHIPASFGASFTEVTFIGLKGEWESRRREAVQAVYESRAMPKDHKVPEEQGAGWKL